MSELSPATSLAAGAPARSARALRRHPEALAVALALLGAVAGCRDGGATREEGAAAVRRYTVRGEVVRPPQDAAGKRQVGIRHEAIDDFVNEAGAAVGMGSMVMSFEAAPGVSLEDLRVGDKVEILLAVGWSPPALRIEQLRKLPPDTALEFREARPPASR